MATLSELLNEKLKLTDQSDERLTDGIGATEVALFTALVALLKKLSTEGGRLVNNETTATLLAGLRKEIFGVIQDSTYISKVQRYLTDFDKIEALNRSVYENILGQEIKTNLTLEKRLIVDDVTEALTKASSINTNYTNPIRKVLTEGVARGLTVKEVEDNLRRLVKGTTDRGGLFKRYTSQIARDAVGQFDGAVNDKIKESFQLDGFRYVGSLIKDSRSNCKDWVNGTGPYKKYAIRKGTFRVEDIPAMIRIAKDRPGWNPDTRPETFATYRGGFRCRHSVYYFRLKQSEIDKVDEQLNS